MAAENVNRVQRRRGTMTTGETPQLSEIGNARVLVVGPVPDPVTGQSAITAAIVSRLDRASAAYRLVDLTFRRTQAKSVIFQRWIWALRNIYQAIFELLRSDCRALYFSLSSGRGQWQDLVILGAARLLHKRIVVHHHCFGYLTHKRNVTALVTKVVGKSGIHVALCDCMADELRKQYDVQTTLVCSNSGFIDHTSCQDQTGRNSSALKVGMLSNLTFEKGLDRFCALVIEARAVGVELEGYIAGPLSDAPTRDWLAQKCARYSFLHYVGPVYAESKSQFLQSLDVFAFLTRYANEAEPLVLDEAMAVGLAVISTHRGCIADMLPAEAVLLDDVAIDIGPAVSALRAWADGPAKLKSAKAASIRAFQFRAPKGAKQVEQLLNTIVWASFSPRT